MGLMPGAALFPTNTIVFTTKIAIATDIFATVAEFLTYRRR
jgi:hypothetical protein